MKASKKIILTITACVLTPVIIIALWMTYKVGYYVWRLSTYKQPIVPSEATYRLNPNPKQGYKLTLEFDPNLDVQIYTPHSIYNILNKKQCSPVMGITWTSEDDYYQGIHTIKHTLSSPEKNKFITVIYLDAMLNENYYNQGICEWNLLDKLHIDLELNQVFYSFSLPKDFFINQLKQDIFCGKGIPRSNDLGNNCGIVTLPNQNNLYKVSFSIEKI